LPAPAKLSPDSLDDPSLWMFSPNARHGQLVAECADTVRHDHPAFGRGGQSCGDTRLGGRIREQTGSVRGPVGEQRMLLGPALLAIFLCLDP
jgi:hypothetical protein